ncbi:MarR family transcriptional regulator [Actinopolymorpha alba]|uniref:MarR family transcriptional regulator n=1 Tax=Actinopolymorpha alba TaxID=533267 RepID=UPI00035D406F|nr:MarR family transcriptional regulator [Actinopolymorpha alba]
MNAETVTGAATAVQREEATRLYLAIARTSRWLRRQGAPERGDLGHGGISALATLAHAGPMRLSELAAREQVAPPTLSRVVAFLEQAGYAVREADPKDGRVSIVRATDEGRQIAQGLRSARTKALQDRLGRLSAEEYATLLAALPALEALVGDDG